MGESNNHPLSTESTAEWSETDAAETDPVEPDIDRVLETVFGFRSVDLRVYNELLEQGPATSNDLACAIGRHRSYVNRALTSLCQQGLAHRQRRLLPDGGFQYVYVPKPRQEALEALDEGIEQWATEARARLHEVL